MWFSFLLWLVLWRIRFRLFVLKLTNKTLWEELSHYNFSLQIQTLDHSILRRFQFSYGKLTSPANTTSTNDDEQLLIISFNNTKEASEIASAIREEKHQIFTFIQEQKVKIEGDLSLLQTLFEIKEKLDKVS